LTVFFAPLGSLHIIAAHKMLVKLTQGEASSIGNSAKNLGPLSIDKWEKNNNGLS